MVRRGRMVGNLSNTGGQAVRQLWQLLLQMIVLETASIAIIVRVRSMGDEIAMSLGVITSLLYPVGQLVPYPLNWRCGSARSDHYNFDIIESILTFPCSQVATKTPSLTLLMVPLK